MAESMRSLVLGDLGLQPYDPVHALQQRLVTARQAGETGDLLLLVEHPPVLTLGRRADKAHILSTEEVLRRERIDVVPTGRGGDVTYHGPGQLVGYPIIDLGDHGLGAAGYVGRLENVLIAVLAAFGITAGTDPINRGVWVGQNKIAAIGVRISRQVSMHGFALNVHTDMSHFSHIVPCGIQGRGVTSMHLLCADPKMSDVKAALCDAFVNAFGYASIVRRGPRDEMWGLPQGGEPAEEREDSDR